MSKYGQIQLTSASGVFASLVRKLLQYRSYHHLPAQHLFYPSTTQYPLQFKPIIPTANHTTSYIARVHSIVEERISQKLREKLRMCRWPIKKDVADASDFIPGEDCG